MSSLNFCEFQDNRYAVQLCLLCTYVCDQKWMFMHIKLQGVFFIVWKMPCIFHWSPKQQSTTALVCLLLSLKISKALDIFLIKDIPCILCT